MHSSMVGWDSQLGGGWCVLCIGTQKDSIYKFAGGKPEGKNALNLTDGQMADTDFELCYNFRHQEMEKEQIYRHE